MPYIFPSRVLVDGDILDPVDLNDDIIPVTEIYSGGLNEHNLKGGSSPGLGGLSETQLAPGALYGFKQRTKIIDPDMGLPPGPFSRPQTTAANFGTRDRVPNDSGWVPVPLNDAGDTSISTTTQSAAIWIEALVQYAVGPNTMDTASYTGTPPAAPDSSRSGRYLSTIADENLGGTMGARLQFALRLDGAVIPWTITGHEDPYAGSPRGEKPSVAYQISSVGELVANAPGPKIEYDTDLGQLGGYISPVRLGSVVSVTAGSHTIELVARRSQFLDQTIALNIDDVIGLYTRKLVLIEIPQIPRAESTFDSIEVTPFDSESELTQAAFDNSIVAARTKLNAIKDGAVARGALRDVHLPSGLLGSFTVFRTASTAIGTSNVFPGFSDLTSVNVNPGWDVLLSGSVAYSGTRVSDKLVVFADVHVQHLQRFPASGDENDVMGALAVVYSTDGGTTWTVVQDSIVYFNNSQNMFINNGTTALRDVAIARVNLNVPTMAVIGTLSSGSTYTVGVAGCVIPTVLSSGSYTFSSEMRVQRMNLSGFILRGD